MSNEMLVLAGSRRRLVQSGTDLTRWLVILLFIGLGIGLRSPWPADEPRFVLAAMDMVLNDHWLLPHRGGEIYADKPPFFMWLQGVFFVVTGNMRIAFLLPSLVAAMATLWLVHDLTKRLFGREQAWFAVLLLLVTVQFTAQAKSAQIDMTLCALTTLGLYGLIRHHCLGPDAACNAVAWLAMGVGVITKGVGFLPVFLLPGLAAARWLNRKDTGQRPKANWTEYLTPLLIILPALLWLSPLWFVAYVKGRPDVAGYLQEILFRQTVTRYAEGLGHARPPWYYLTSVIPGLWMPLSVLLFWLVPDWIRRLREFSALHWALLGFVALGLLFFSMSPGKRGVYMLPLLPPLAIVAGGSLHTLVRRKGPIRTMRTIVAVVGLLLILAAAATSFDLGPLTNQLERAEINKLPAMLLLFSIGASWLVAMALFDSGGAYSLAITATWILISTWGYVVLDPVRSADELMAEVSTHLSPTDELAIVGFKEQQVLQADRPVTHWGYHEDPVAQVSDAVDWLRESNGRFVLIAERTSMLCFGEDAGIWLGHRHRRDWRLVAATDIASDLDCADGPRKPKRFQAPFSAYPGGPG